MARKTSKRQQDNDRYVPLFATTPLEILDECIKALCENIHKYTKNSSDFIRNRKMNAYTTIRTMLNMQGQSLNKELIDAFPNMDERVTASAFVQQKAKLTLDMFLAILRNFNAQKPEIAKEKLYKGKYALYAVDGSDFNPVYHADSKYAIFYNQVSNKKANGDLGKPYSQIHANMLYNLSDRSYEDVVLQPRSQMDERSACIDMIHRLDENTKSPFIFIADRGYEGFNIFAHGNSLKNGKFVIRVRTSKYKNIKEITELSDEECDVETVFHTVTSTNKYSKRPDYYHYINNAPKKSHKAELSKKTRYVRWDFEDEKDIPCRIVKFQINDPDSGKEVWEVLVTNLPREEASVDDLKELYHMRWGIETSFRDLKYALGGIQFHSKKDEFVEMELVASLIMYNAVSQNINLTDVGAKGKNDKYVVSFSDATAVVRRFFRQWAKDAPWKIFDELRRYTRPASKAMRKHKRNTRTKSQVWFMYRVA